MCAYEFCVYYHVNRPASRCFTRQVLLFHSRCASARYADSTRRVASLRCRKEEPRVVEREDGGGGGVALYICNVYVMPVGVSRGPPHTPPSPQHLPFFSRAEDLARRGAVRGGRGPGPVEYFRIRKIISDFRPGPSIALRVYRSCFAFSC